MRDRKELYGFVRLELMAYIDAQKSCSKATHDIVDMICDAIDAERCIWKLVDHNGKPMYQVCEDGIYFEPSVTDWYSHCPCCGKKIEVSP